MSENVLTPRSTIEQSTKLFFGQQFAAGWARELLINLALQKGSHVIDEFEQHERALLERELAKAPDAKVGLEAAGALLDTVVNEARTDFLARSQKNTST